METSKESLHQKILSDIETRIVSGEWPPVIASPSKWISPNTTAVRG